MALSLPPELSELARRFLALYTGAVTDVLDRLGYMQQTLPPAIRPLREGMRLAGPAYPVEGRPRPGADYDVSIRKTLAMLGAIPPGHVAVYQTHDRSSAHLGELSVTSLKARGCAGAVIDGGCRDVEYILRQDYPVFCRHVTPQDCTRRWEVVAHGDVSVTVGGVRVSLGDYVVADHDGVVIVPEALVTRVLEEAEAVVTTESAVRRAVGEGMLPLEAYET
ncbi:MAG: methyltransferase, partial [Thermoleophilia bacterium]